MLKQISSVLIGVCLTAQIATADVWRDFAEYQYNGQAGKNEHVAKEVEKIVQETPVKQYGDLEEKLVAVVSSKDATPDAKAISCRFLQQIGSDKCVPAVSKLLDRKILSHYARLVLERLESEKADAALRKGLRTAPDQIKPGILLSIAARQDKDALREVCRLAKSKDAAIAESAIRALGSIGGKDAASCLSGLDPKEQLVAVKMRALLACAQDSGKEAALSLCEKVLAGPYWPARAAALKLLAEMEPEKAFPLVFAAVTCDDSKRRDAALQIVSNSNVGGLTKPIIELLDCLPPPQRSRLITALGYRGDRKAQDKLVKYVDSKNSAVRKAAIEALGKLGDRSTVETLLRASKDGENTAAIKKALIEMAAKGTADELIAALENRRHVDLVIAILAARGEWKATPALLELTKEDDQQIRQKAWDAVARLATEESIDSVVAEMMDADNDPQLSEAAKMSALKVVAGISDDNPGKALTMAKKLKESSNKNVAEKSKKLIEKLK